ncbi:MAG: IS200/IS605 family transposase [Vulcanimicrobiaceae bacterium]
MASASDLRTGRHCVFALHAHLVFVTKYRRNVFTKVMLDALRPIFESVCRDFEVELVEFDGEDDHVHLLVNYPPKAALSSLVNSLKGVSSRLLRKQFPVVVKRYWKSVLWSPSYFAASCGGAPLSIIKQYIENQRMPL